MATQHRDGRRLRAPQFEQLEDRRLLAGVVCQESLEASDVATGTTSALSPVSIRGDAGATRSTALNLGVVTGERLVRGSVGGADRSDVMRFTLASPTTVTVGLRGLSADLDLTLYDQHGRPLALSRRGGRQAEEIRLALPAGTYFLKVAPWLRRSFSRYELTIDVPPRTVPPANQPPNLEAPRAAPVSSPTPADPPAVTAPPVPFADVAYYGGPNDWHINAIGAPEAWANGYRGEGITVAIVDTGIDLDHPDLQTNLWVNVDEIEGNGIDDDGNGYIDDRFGWDFAHDDNLPNDTNGHGTHVAGIVAAAANGYGATGVAPLAAIMPIQVLAANGSGSSLDVAAGIRYAADNGAQIINLSLGGGYNSAIEAAIAYAGQQGALVVAAAGNESAATPGYPAAFSASYDHVLSVGAHTSTSERSGFSNRVGASNAVQVAAPGSGIYSAYRDNRFARLSGTSMAAPSVAGIAALALSANPQLSASQLRSLIVSGSRRSIAGADGRGGVDAAYSVAYAAAGLPSGSTSSGNTNSPAADTQGVTQQRQRSSIVYTELSSSVSERQTVAAVSAAAVPLKRHTQPVASSATLPRASHTIQRATDKVMRLGAWEELDLDGAPGFGQPSELPAELAE